MLAYYKIKKNEVDKSGKTVDHFGVNSENFVVSCLTAKNAKKALRSLRKKLCELCSKLCELCGSMTHCPLGKFNTILNISFLWEETVRGVLSDIYTTPPSVLEYLER